MKDIILNKLGIQERSAFNILNDKELCERIINEDPIWLDDFVKEYDISKSVLQRMIKKNIVSNFSNIKGKGSKVFIFKNETLSVFKLNYHNTAQIFRDITNVVELYLMHVKGTISNREYEIIHDTLINNISYEDMVEKYDLTRERIRQIYEKANRRVRHSYRISIDYEKLKSEYESLRFDVEILKHKRLVLSKSKVLEQENIKNYPNHEILNKKIYDMDVSVRLLNALNKADITTLGDVVSMKREDFLKFRNFGVKSLKELDEVLKDYKLSYGMFVPKLT
jgi:hypothetical protein